MTISGTGLPLSVLYVAAHNYIGHNYIRHWPAAECVVCCPTLLRWCHLDLAAYRRLASRRCLWLPQKKNVRAWVSVSGCGVWSANKQKVPHTMSMQIHVRTRALVAIDTCMCFIAEEETSRLSKLRCSFSSVRMICQTHTQA